MDTVELINVYRDSAAYGILYDLLAERTPEQSISHKEMPTYSKHVAFIDSKPYKAWYLVIDETEGYVGSIYLSKQNEIGVFIFKAHHGKGYGEAAVKKLMWNHPLDRVGRYVANVNPKNKASQELFEKLGFKLIDIQEKQLVYVLE